MRLHDAARSHSDGLYINTPESSVTHALQFQALVHGLLLALQRGMRVVRVCCSDLIKAGQVRPWICRSGRYWYCLVQDALCGTVSCPCASVETLELCGICMLPAM